MRLRPDDEFVVMGCDGLWDHVAYDTAIEIVAALKKAGKSAAPNHLNHNDHLKHPNAIG
jgi:serine/threonine protein phosphatase PrpC